MSDVADTSWLRFDYFPAGTELIRQGGSSGSLIVLKEGEIEVERDGAHVFSTKQPGAIFGEISVLLQRPHSATVRAVTDVQIFVIDEAARVLEAHPSWLMQIARLLAQRVTATTEQLLIARAAQAGGDEEALILPARMFSAWADPQV